MTAYAAGWEFVSFWCSASILIGVDNSAGGPNLFLTDTLADFVRGGFEPGVGMPLWNLTAGTSGPISSVTPDILTATGVSFNPGDAYRAVTLTVQEAGVIENMLALVSADIDAALAAQGMLNCTRPAWANDLLKKINIIEAAAFYSCACSSPGLPDEVKARYLEWANAQLEAIRTGKLELCGGTGAEYPAIAWAEQAVTEWNAAQIIVNDAARGT